ncbi:MAG TPA: aminomethyltransferase family protein [Candidatus Limnocylindrales bacterium]|nr:aminomethyltransferase family protein [Candidatus Limnocylindrales bacterium]
MSVGTAFHPRTADLNRKQQWREWSGYFASSVYADAHDIEYNAIREAAALIDVSPLYKYRVHGPDAGRLVDRVITRDATKLTPGRVYYTPWCDEFGKVIDDGTVHALDDGSFRWTAADPQMRWLRLNARGLDVAIDDVTEGVAALALQGPLSRAVLEAATAEGWADLRYFRRRAGRLAGIDAAIDVSRTGYTGDLGYELWIPADQAVAAWDALMAAGRAFGIRPAGMLALDVVRLEAGLILLEVDYTSARHAINPEQNYSPFEIGLGRLVSFEKGDFVGRLALEREARRGGPTRRLVGVELDWYGIERLYSEQGLPPAISPSVDRSPVPVFAPRGGQVGKVTSLGWSPILKQAIGLASVPPSLEAVGSRVEVEWTVEGRRGRVPAQVVSLPFLDLQRKRD